MSLTSVPTLDELAADPARAADLPPEVVRALTLRALAALAALATLPTGNGTGAQHSSAEDRLLDIGGAAEILGVSPDFLYRRAGRLPFTVRLPGRLLRFSVHGIAQYIRSRSGH